MLSDDLDGMVKGPHPNDGRRDQRWEESVVKRILKAGGHAQMIHELLRESAETTDEARLYFDTFLEAFPDFPVWLHCRKIPYMYQTALDELLDPRQAKRSKIYRAYSKARDEVPGHWDDRPVGLVFELLHAGGRFKIFHDGQHDLSGGAELASARCRIVIPEGQQRKVYWLDNLDYFLRLIGWTRDANATVDDEDPEEQ